MILRTLLLTLGTLVFAAGAQTPETEPGPEHAALMSLSGEYSSVTRYYWRPGDPPEESTGVATFTSVLGGRFLLQQDLDEAGAESSSGVRIYGFNRAAARYEAAWVYDRSTGLLTMSGQSADGGKTIVLSGSWNEGPDRLRLLNATIRVRDADSFSIELSGETAQDPRVETVFTRR